MDSVNTELKGAIESIIFISEGPVAIADIQNIMEGLDIETINAAISELKNEYEQRNSGIKLVEVAGGFQMVTSPKYSHFIKKFYKLKHSEKLTMPSLETLSIIAYKQPVTKLEIESIRGVNIDGVLKNLMEKDLIRITGRKEVIGRPFVYGTTKSFLEYFGLNSLEELPPIEEFVQVLSERELAQISPLREEAINTQGSAVENAPLSNENIPLSSLEPNNSEPQKEKI